MKRAAVARPRLVAAAAMLLAIGCGPPGTPPSDWTEPAESPFVIGPYILLGGPGRAHVVVEARLPEPPVVEYRTAHGGALVEVTAEASGRNLWVATLRNLPTDQFVLYRVRSVLGNSGEHRFRASVRAGNPVRIAAFGDTRDGHLIHRRVAEAVAKEQVDVVLHTGDMVARGGVRRHWNRFFQIERPLLASTPILPAIGNHDMGNGFYFKHYFQHKRWAGSRRYYSHDWGNLRLVAVDSGIECRDGCAQYLFAERALAEGAQRGMLMIMFLHHPPYSSGRHGDDESVKEPITELARKYGVELVITGHDHNYERTVPVDGTTYIVSGSAGAPIRPVSPRDVTAHARTEPHYVLIDVEGDVMTLRAVNLDGDAFDTAVLPALPPESAKKAVARPSRR